MHFCTSLKGNECFSHEYFLQENICRLCWSKDADLEILSKSLTELESSTDGMIKKIKYCLGLQIDEQSYPKRICLRCHNKVEEYYNFKNFCMEADEKLQGIIKTFHKGKQILHDVKIEKLDFSTEDLSNRDYEDIFESFPGSDYIDSCIDIKNTKDEVIIENIKLKKRKCEDKKIFIPSKLSESELTDEKDESKLQNKLKKSVRKKNICQQKSSMTKINNLSLIETENLENKTESDLANISKEKKNLLKKRKYHLKRSATYCNICRLDFVTREKIATHNAQNHGIEDEGSSFKCFGCDKRFKTRKARLGHEVNTCKGLKDGYQCPKCDRFLPRRSTYEVHMRDHRENPLVELPENVFQCSKCYELFKTKNCLKTHMSEHESGKKTYVCETCGRVFTRRDYLHKHKLIHTGTKHHVCPHCGYRASQRSTLTVHLRKHTGERPYSCDMCPQRCISSSNLLAHRRRHLGDKKFQCTICNKQFGYKISLEEHIASLHERSQSFSCEQCGALYTRARGLRRHLLLKHGKQKKERDKKEPEKSEIDNMYLKITTEVMDADAKKVKEVDFEIKDSEEFVLLNPESEVMLSKIYE